MTDEDTSAELERLREHNKQLLAELKAAKAEAKAASEASTEAQKARDDYKARWYALEVSAPLESDLRGCAAGPWKYLRDVATESGLLKMEADDEGVERPQWIGADGKPADLSRGLYQFLSDTYGSDTTRFHDLGHSLKARVISGSGADSSSHAPTATAPPKTAEDHKQPTQNFGLR